MIHKHSFAVLAYKDSPYLPDCLDSLKKQSVESRIYISTSTPSAFITETAKKYGIDVFVTETGLGIAHDWNFSLQNANTKYVTLAHQDDIYMPGYTETCLQNAEKYADTLICFTNYAEIMDGKDRSGTLLLRVKLFLLWFFMPFNKSIRNKFWKRRFLATGSPIAAPSVLYNLERLGHFNFSPEFRINMDWEAWYRMSGLEGRFVYVSKMLMKHRIHGDSATTKGIETNFRQNEDLKMFNRFWPGFVSKILAKIYTKSYHSNQL